MEKINKANHCIQTEHHRNKPEDSYDSCLVRFSGIKMFEKRTHLCSITSNTVSRKISNSQNTNLSAVKKSQRPQSKVSCPCEVKRMSRDYVFPRVLCVAGNLVRQEKQIGHTLCSNRKMQLQMSTAAKDLVITKDFS